MTVREEFMVPPFQDTRKYWYFCMVTPAPWTNHILMGFAWCFLCLKQWTPPFVGWGTNNLISAAVVSPSLPEPQKSPPKKKERREKGSEKLVCLFIGFFVLLLLLTEIPLIGYHFLSIYLYFSLLTFPGTSEGRKAGILFPSFDWGSGKVISCGHTAN